MRSFLVCIALFSAFFTFAQQTEIKGKLEDTGKSAEKVARQARKGKIYLVDVRTPEEYRTGHLKYAQNIDFKSAEFKENVGKLQKKKSVYLYCRSGNRSGKAVDTLKILGFADAVNIGGFENLKKEGLPTEQ